MGVAGSKQRRTHTDAKTGTPHGQVMRLRKTTERIDSDMKTEHFTVRLLRHMYTVTRVTKRP